MSDLKKVDTRTEREATFIKKNTTFGRGEISLAVHDEICEYIQKSPLHMKCWNLIFEEIGHVYIHMTEPKDVRMRLTISISPIPQNRGKHDGKTKLLQNIINVFIEEAVKKVEMNSIFHCGRMGLAGTRDEPRKIVMDPQSLVEWDKLHEEGRYYVSCLVRSDGNIEMKRSIELLYSTTDVGKIVTPLTEGEIRDVSPLFIMNHSIFFNVDGKELGSVMNIALCIAENEYLMDEWKLLHKGGFKVRCIFDGTIIPRKMNSCKMSRIVTGTGEEEISGKKIPKNPEEERRMEMTESLIMDRRLKGEVERLKKDVERLEEKIERLRDEKEIEGKRLKEIEALTSEEGKVLSVERNTTIYTGGKMPLFNIDVCPLIVKSSFHFSWWKKIYPIMGHVHCEILYHGSFEYSLYMEGTKKALFPLDDDVPDDKPSKILDELEKDLHSMIDKEKNRVRDRTSFSYSGGYEQTPQIDKNSMATSIIRNPGTLIEWNQTHDGQYWVNYTTSDGDHWSMSRGDKI